jgi:hypothetical protein
MIEDTKIDQISLKNVKASNCVQLLSNSHDVLATVSEIIMKALQTATCTNSILVPTARFALHENKNHCEVS